MDYTAPNEIKVWLECLFWFLGIGAAIIFIVKQMRGATPRPPNESLALTSDELTRRVSHLETENKQIWEKMERDRVECKDAIAKIGIDIGALKKETELGNQRACVMDLKIDRLLSRS